jgi:arsenite methyltransferase
VIGVDRAPQQLEKAEAAGRSMAIANVGFNHGRIGTLPLEDASIDVVLSNGAINVVSAKSRVFCEIARVLKPGGRAAIVDLVGERPIAAQTAAKVALWTPASRAPPRPTATRS